MFAVSLLVLQAFADLGLCLGSVTGNSQESAHLKDHQYVQWIALSLQQYREIPLHDTGKIVRLRGLIERLYSRRQQYPKDLHEQIEMLQQQAQRLPQQQPSM